MTNDNTIITRHPKIVTSHKGILAKNPTSPIAFVSSSGNDTEVAIVPMFPAIEDTMPPHILKIAVIMSIPYVTAVLANTKRMKNRSPYSGLLISLKLTVLLQILIAKNKTNSP